MTESEVAERMNLKLDPSDARPLAQFARIIAVNEALPDDYFDKITDETPLRELMAGVWPTWGDLRRLVQEHGKDLRGER